ncbi:MAG: hypothetical protein JSU09_16460 [Bacteroidetes bacterium]|nr:hypothetical protein [Bacteroidota bacterium]
MISRAGEEYQREQKKSDSFSAIALKPLGVPLIPGPSPKGEGSSFEK